MNKNPLVSIITPVYNCSKYIEQCIKTVGNQTYNNIEHIIIDGNSTDETLEIIKKYANQYKIRWISEKDNGMYDAINKGINIAKGEILAWLNADDIYFPWTIESVVKVFEDHKINWCTGIPGNINSYGLYWQPNKVIPTYSRRLILKGYYHGRGLGTIQQESTFWTKELWNKAGGKINTVYKYAGDYELWKQFSYYETLYTINVCLAAFRIHEEQKSADSDKYFYEIKNDINSLKLFLWVLNKTIRISNILYIFNRRNLINVKYDLCKKRKALTFNDVKKWLARGILKRW